MLLKLNDWGITTRVFFLALVPVALVTFVLGFYIINSRTDDLVNEINNKGQVIADSLASASEFGVATENISSLHSIVQSVKRNPDVTRIVIYNSINQPVYVSDTRKVPEQALDPHSQEFTATIYRTELAPDEFVELGSEQQENSQPMAIGYVKVYLSGEPFVQRQNIIIINSIMISILGLLISLMLAMLISRGVTLPVKQLMAAVSSLRKGDYSIRISRFTGGELGDLQKGVNNMAEKIEVSHQYLEQQVEKAVGRYKDSINELQQRNYELQAARRAAMRAGEAKSEFLANMSHEIRTPLNAIVGFSERLSKTAVNHDQVEYAHTVSSAANQLLAVVDDVLNFSKLESGKMDIKPTDVDIRDVLEDIVTMLSGSAHEKKLELVLLVDSDVPQIVRLDPDRLRQVLINLVNNSVKFTDAGDVVMHASVSDMNNSRYTLRFEVSDTGIGIDSSQQDKLFTPFTQADMSSTRKYGGTGLGLAISRRILDLMHGKIWLESEKGKGATFYVEIPVESKTQVADANKKALSGYSALLFDPHLYSRRALRNGLLYMGMNTFSASTEAALESMLSEADCDARYDVLIISLPASSDTSAMMSRLLPVVQANYNGPLLVLTGDEEYVASHLVDHGSRTAFALKPIRNASLRHKLLEIFGALEPLQVSQEINSSARGGLQHIDRILIAEDNDFNRMYLSRLLEDQGIRTDCVIDGQQAVDMATQHDYDLILMDVHMPVLDGVEATEFIRSVLGDSCPPIVAVTADVFANDSNEMPGNGFSGCLLKPIDEELLFETISKVCAQGAAIDTCRPRSLAETAREKSSPLLEQVRHIPADLLEKLIEELPEHVTAIRQYIDQADFDALRERLHMFLGVCSYFGITDLETAIRALQQSARSGDLSRATEQLGNISGIIQELEKAWYAETA